jgi:hypothetical protein
MIGLTERASIKVSFYPGEVLQSGKKYIFFVKKLALLDIIIII